MTELNNKQRGYLRGLAHGLRPVVQIGQHGITDALVKAVHHALLEHELIKVKMHEPEDKRAMAQELGERSGAALCGAVGHVVILYRPHPDEPQLELP